MLISTDQPAIRVTHESKLIILSYFVFALKMAQRIVLTPVQVVYFVFRAARFSIKLGRWFLDYVSPEIFLDRGSPSSRNMDK
jgi:hypothetical protein